MKMQIFSFIFLCLLLTACSQPAESVASATLLIVNSSAQPVCKVHLTSMDGDEIDVLLLSMDRPLDVGENVGMQVPVNYPLNIAIEDCAGNFLESVKGLKIPIEGLSYVVGGAN